MTTTLLAPAKVNLCLFLGPARTLDGRHELVTVFDALTLADLLLVETGVAADEVICPGVEGPNLAADALAALRDAGWDAPPLRVTIAKQIPVAAGMGGGSSDAAAVLSLVWREQTAERFAAGDGIDVHAIASRLGADVSAMIEPGLWLASGAGDEGLVHFPAGLPEHAYVVVPSALGLSTAAVYREADRLGLGRSAAELEQLMPRVRAALSMASGSGRPFPPELLVNDLQPAALSLCPSIATALEALAEAGAAQAIVSGSGPTTVGIWWGEGSAVAAESAASVLSGRFRGAQAALPSAGSSQFGPIA